MNEIKKPLVVTTAHKGVFFGYGIQTDAETITLTDARMCVYWSKKMHGIMGLAAIGPDKSCKIGPAVPCLVLREVTAIIEVTPTAEEMWICAPTQHCCPT